MIAYYAVHPLELLDVDIVVGFVELALSTPGGGGAVLFVCGFGVVESSMEETSKGVSWAVKLLDRVTYNRSISLLLP